MLSHEERAAILDRYLCREEERRCREEERRHEVEKKKKKREERLERLERMNASCGTQSDVRWLITTECNDIRDKIQFMRLLVENNTKEWTKLLYTGGYLCPLFIPFKTTEEMRKERKSNVKKRYQTWKRLRPYLRLHGIAENTTMYPAYQHTIFRFRCRVYKDEKYTCNVFIQMILNYIPFYNVFLYDPLEDKPTGYKYYSGEPLIIYYLTQGIINNANKRKRIREAIFKRKANGYSLRNVWKIVICTGEWKVLEDQRGTGSFKLFETDPNCEEICAECLLFWKDFFYSRNKTLFDVYNVIQYSINEKILPWPYYVKDKKKILLESVKRPQKVYKSYI